jgi:aspartyl-tRNA(Asn)/glutamyl-tRNA(Gln) amidotransferase subunit C
MSKISLDDVKKLAALAKLSLTDEEASRFTNEIAAILEYVAQLSAVDTNGVEPTSQVTGLVNVTRPDEIIDYGVSPRELIEKQRLDDASNMIKVRRVL